MHDGVDDALLVGAVDGPTVEERAAPAGGAEELATGRIEHHAQHRLTLDDQADTDGEEGDAVGVVDGAVQRVDDPQSVGPRAPFARLARFLGQEAVVGEGAADDLEDDLLAQSVSLGDDVLLALEVDALEPLIQLHLDRAGGAGSLGRRRQLTGEIVVGHTLMLPAPTMTGRGASCRGP